MGPSTTLHKTLTWLQARLPMGSETCWGWMCKAGNDNVKAEGPSWPRVLPHTEKDWTGDQSPVNNLATLELVSSIHKG